MNEHIGYIRVSSEGQNIDRQLDGVHLDKRYIDKISGQTKDRPQLNACLQYMRTGDTLHVHSIDRLARSLRDLQEIVDGLVKRGVVVRFHNENLIFTAEENPISTMMMQLLGVIAQFERTLTKRRQREGIAIAKSIKHCGRPKLDLSRRGEAQQLRSEGHTITAIAKTMNLSRPSIDKLLS